MRASVPSSPYVGLRPYREEDFAFFFGRDREVRVIASNLEARPFTVLYGASGVGKSSVLQAGVLRRLKHASGVSVFYFRDWQSDSLLQQTIEAAHRLVAGSDSEAARTGAHQVSERAFLLLDQFEEFLLYHANDGLGQEFDTVLSRIINRKDCPVNVLIGIRDDSLFKLDRRLSLRIPNLLRDTLELERMTPVGAQTAIEKPLAVFSEKFGDGIVHSVEPALVEEILIQVQAGQVHLGESSGIGIKRGPKQENRIETAYLQLVMTKLWEEERRQSSPTLRLRTLHQLGGADNIVRSHVNSVMDRLDNERDRYIAANMFQYLVTPSRSKIAQTTKDLVTFAERPESEVKEVLNALTNRSESRILRRLSDPEQYEIFHDVLAQPLLDWRRARLDKIKRKRLWRRLLTGGVVVLLLLLGFTAWLSEQKRTQAATKFADAMRSQAESAQRENEAYRVKRQADEARLSGNKAEADRLTQQARQYAALAATLQQKFANQQETLDSTNRQALAKIQAATHERDDALHKLTAAQKERDDLRTQLEAVRKELQDPQKSRSPSQMQGRPAQKGEQSVTEKRERGTLSNSATESKVAVETTEVIFVPAKVNWTKTVLNVVEGQQISFTASGQIKWDEGDKSTVGPGGSTEKLTARVASYPVASMGVGGLIGKIGDRGRPFTVGEKARITAPTSGRLYLGINDNFFGNNSGQFRVEITTIPTASQP